MTTKDRIVPPALFPVLRCHDVAAAIEWLCKAFGFERGHVFASARGEILYAQLTLGNAMVMLEPASAGPSTPDEPDGPDRQGCYIVIGDADAHYARATAAGAEIVLDIENFGQGGRGYSCRDNEGHVWSFGTYDPWQSEVRTNTQPEPDREPSPALQPPQQATIGRASARWAVLSGLLATILTSAVAAAWINGADQQIAHGPTVSIAAAPISTDDLARERSAREAAERTAQEAEQRIAAERDALEKASKKAAEDAASQTTSLLLEERTARAAAERAADEARSELGREKSAKEAAEKTATELERRLAAREKDKEITNAATKTLALTSQEEVARRLADAEAALREAAALKEKLAIEQAAREAAERTRDEAREEIDRERDTSEAANRTAAELKEQLAKEQSAKAAAERTANETQDQISRERAAKDQAWKTVAQLRKQLARAQVNAGASDYAASADASEESSSPGNGGASKKAADPQYNGPLSPF